MQKKVNWPRWLFAALTVAVMVFIFWNSGRTGQESSAISSPLVERLAALLIPKWEQLSLAARERHLFRLTNLVRESAHVAEFAALSFFALLFALSWGKDRWRCAAAFAFCVLYALSDEIHQLYVPGRTFQLLDLGMDTLGALLGTLAAQLLRILWQRRREKQQR